MADSQRRSFLKWLVNGLSALVGVTLAAPAAALLGHPLRRRTIYGGEDPIPVADLARLPEGVPVVAKVVAPARFDAWLRVNDVPLGAVWLLRRGDEVRALSASCPHAGCFIDYEANAGRFACPCHQSAFALDGSTLSGPAPRPMDSLPVEVKGGKVLVRFQRFRQALRRKETV
jgi:Rieske Fe-S protein